MNNNRNHYRELGIGAPARYSNVEIAERARSNFNKPSDYRLITGDDGKIWIVSHGDAARLRKNGFEFKNVNHRGETW